jgi:hypothetical protein
MQVMSMTRGGSGRDTAARHARGSGSRTPPRAGLTGRDVRWRGLTAAGVAVSAVVHLELWAAGMRFLDVVGPAFLLNAVGGLAIAVAVLFWRHWLPLLAAVGFGLSTLGAFVLSATVGFFGVHEMWSGVPQVLSAVSEVVAVVFGAAALLAERRR